MIFCKKLITCEFDHDHRDLETDTCDGGIDHLKNRMFFNIRHDQILICHRFAQQLLKHDKPSKVPEDYVRLKRLIANYGKGVPEPPSPVLESKKMADAIDKAYFVRTTNKTQTKQINGKRWVQNESRKLLQDPPSSPRREPISKKPRAEQNDGNVPKPPRGRQSQQAPSIASSSRTRIDHSASAGFTSRAASMLKTQLYGWCTDNSSATISSQIQIGVDNLQIREPTRESSPDERMEE